MTWMPWSQPPAPPAISASSPTILLAKRLLAPWHAACFAVLCAGCLYVGPITLLVDENVPPEIFAASTDVSCQEQFPDEMNALCIYPSTTGEGAKVFVIARDDNDDALVFTWIGGDGFIEDAVPSSSGDFQSSEVELTPDDVMDGEVLTCSVSDGLASVEKTWTLVVFE
jgi:hypothetical protein